MSRMGAVSAAEKVAAVGKYLSGKESHASIAKAYGVSRSTFQKWLSNYQAMGEAGLDHRKGNQRYPESLKKDAVSDYVSGQFGLKMICEKYQIRSRTQLERLVLLYNGHSKQPDQGCNQGTKLCQNQREHLREQSNPLRATTGTTNGWRS